MYLALKVTFCVQVYGAIWLRRYFPVNFFLTIFFTSLGIAVMGYHPGLEDDGIYLSAIQADLNPFIRMTQRFFSYRCAPASSPT
jgi:hypothetical protein